MKKKHLYILAFYLLLTGCSSTPVLVQENENFISAPMEKDFNWATNIKGNQSFFLLKKQDGFLHFYPTESDKKSAYKKDNAVAIFSSLSSSTGFTVNSAKLNPNINTHLDAIAKAYIDRSQDRGKQYLVITGHTDSSGQWAYNIDLSLKRTLSTAQYLEKQGVPHEAIVLIAAGPDYPLVKNTSIDNKAINRRVEILITEDEEFAASFYRNYHCLGQACKAQSMEVWGYSRQQTISRNLRDLASFQRLRNDLELPIKKRRGGQHRRVLRTPPYSTYIYRKFDITQYSSQ